jgi:hypothetical protein
MVWIMLKVELLLHVVLSPSPESCASAVEPLPLLPFQDLLLPLLEQFRDSNLLVIVFVENLGSG